MAEEPQPLEDLLIEEESSLAAIVRKGEDLVCTPTLPTSWPTMKTRCKRTSCKSWCAEKIGKCWQ